MFLFKVNSFIRSQDSVFDIFSEVANRQNQGGAFLVYQNNKIFNIF